MLVGQRNRREGIRGLKNWLVQGWFLTDKKGNGAGFSEKEQGVREVRGGATDAGKESWGRE